MFANSLIIENRIPLTHLEQHDYHRCEAITIPVQTFLPSVDDWEEVKARMAVLVERQLVLYVPELQILENDVCWHIEHEFSDESQKKSNIVSL